MNAPRPDFAAARATGATAFLVQEHVVISSVVEVLRVMARRIAGGGDVAPEDAREAAFFFSDFADAARRWDRRGGPPTGQRGPEGTVKRGP